MIRTVRCSHNDNVRKCPPCWKEFTGEDLPLSNCCSAVPQGELSGDFGRCSDCLEMAQFDTPEHLTDSLEAQLRETIWYEMGDGLNATDVDNAIASIQRLFSVTGYVRTLKLGDKTVVCNGKDATGYIVYYPDEVMAGQELLDRFEKKLSYDIYGDTNPTNKVDCESVPYTCTCDLIDAIKQAAGIDQATTPVTTAAYERPEADIAAGENAPGLPNQKEGTHE